MVLLKILRRTIDAVHSLGDFIVGHEDLTNARGGEIVGREQDDGTRQATAAARSVILVGRIMKR